MRKPEILLVEDNTGDQRLVMEALRDGMVDGFEDTSLRVLGDGMQVMGYLRRQGEYANAPRPDLILLDLNLPKRDGREVLAEIKSDDTLKRIPVVILTTSRADGDILKSYDYHANCYVTKPADLEQFFSVIRSIRDFWLGVVQLPNPH